MSSKAKDQNGTHATKFWKERVYKETLAQRRMEAMPLVRDGRVDFITTAVVREAVGATSTPYYTRQRASMLWRDLDQRPNLVAGYSTRFLGITDRGLPFGPNLRSTVTRDTFPADVRFEEARRTCTERALFRSTMKSFEVGEPPRPMNSTTYRPAEESEDRNAFTHFLEEHVQASSIVPVRCVPELEASPLGDSVRSCSTMA